MTPPPDHPAPRGPARPETEGSASRTHPWERVPDLTEPGAGGTEHSAGGDAAWTAPAARGGPEATSPPPRSGAFGPRASVEGDGRGAVGAAGAAGDEPRAGFASGRGDSRARGPERRTDGEPYAVRSDPGDPGDLGDGAGAGVGSADPVRVLMHRHRALCARAVDPLEIAAGLETHGVTDRNAAWFSHRDVFSLAEELYARVPRHDEDAEVAIEAARVSASSSARVALGVLHLLPGVLGTATVAGLPGVAAEALAVRLVVGGVLVAGALWLCLRHGPLRIPPRAPGRGAGAIATVCGGWLVGYALFGDRLLTRLSAGGEATGAREAAASAAETAVVLAFAVVPAAWCARWFAVRSRRRLAASRGLAEFAAGARPLLAGAVAVFLVTLPPLILAARIALPGPPHPHPPAFAVVALGGLLFLARLLAVHGLPKAAALGLAAACAAEAAAQAAVLAARTPGGEVFGRPVERLLAAYGPTAVPTVACALAALALLAYGFGALARACAHRGHGPHARHAPSTS